MTEQHSKFCPTANTRSRSSRSACRSHPAKSIRTPHTRCMSHLPVFVTQRTSTRWPVCMPLGTPLLHQATPPLAQRGSWLHSSSSSSSSASCIIRSTMHNVACSWSRESTANRTAMPPSKQCDSVSNEDEEGSDAAVTAVRCYRPGTPSPPHPTHVSSA